jgi:glycosyltransferase involved in cell wall biosynthesis
VTAVGAKKMNSPTAKLKASPSSENQQATTKRIAAFIQCTNLGGMENVAYSLFDQLQSQGFNLKVVTPRPWGLGKPRVLRVDPEARAFNYKGKFGWRSFPVFQRYVQTIGQHSHKIWVTGNCASCLAAARLTGKKILLSHHYHHFENRWSRLRWTLFYLAFGFRLDAITYPTEFTRNEALRIAPWLNGKTHVVRYGFDLHYQSEERMRELKRSARAALGIPQDAFVVGNGGWLIQRKRFDVFLKTAHEVSRQIPNSVFYICGGGPEENRLRRLAEDLGIAKKVHFQGWVQDMSNYYRAWDVLLFNTDFDTSPCTPLEAATYGCLCVASCRYGGLSEFLKHGQTGFLLNEHEPEKLAGFIARLAQDPVLALNIRQQAINLLAREFSNQKAVNFYVNYFGSGSNLKSNSETC